MRGPREVPSASGTILLPLFPDLIVCLQALAREGAIHIMAIILSCFCAALYRWTGQKSVIGFMIGGRPEGAEGIIGPFVRPRPFYIDVAAAETFEDLLQTARQVYQEATRLGRLAPIETFERFKLQRVMANYVRTTAITGQPRSNAASRFTHFDPAVARKFRMREMNLMVIESPFDLKAILSYATGLFTEADANWLADATCRTLKEGSRNRSAKLESILADLPAPPAPAM